MTMTYKEQLLHPNWQRKRLEILQRDDFHCRLCGDGESTLHVHHLQYAKGRLAWEYPNDELVTLCEPCHEEAGELMSRLRDVVAKLPVDGPGNVNAATAMLAGWAHGSQGLDFDSVFQENPHTFVAGEVASRMEDKLHLDGLMALLTGLSQAPRWVAQEVMKQAAADLLKRASEPAPAGWGEDAL